MYPATLFWPAEFLLKNNNNNKNNSADNLMGIPLHIIHCFSIAAFNIFSLNLIFISLNNMCLGIFLLEFILYGTLSASWAWVTISFPMLGKFSTIISLNIFLRHFLFLFFLWDPYNLNVVAFNVVPEVSETVFISFHSFFFILFLCSYFHHSMLQLTFSFFRLSYSVIDSF